MTDDEKLAAANALDAAYTTSDAYHAVQQAKTPTRTVYLINWDNGGDACGTLPWTYETEETAEAAARDIEAENRAQGIWEEDGFCEVVEVEISVEGDADEESADEMGELHKAALHNGQP